ncbi:MAG: hypothetical protein WKF43_02210 [Acidimicrobiales bacterium]
MPEPPNWSDVVFDHAVALAAAEGCDAMALQLRHEATQREMLARAARTDWSGERLDRFVTTSASLDRQSAAVASRLIATANAIRTAAMEARDEQRTREADRSRYGRQVEQQRVENQAEI